MALLLIDAEKWLCYFSDILAFFWQNSVIIAQIRHFDDFFRFFAPFAKIPDYAARGDLDKHIKHR
jgi:hypothetical protein